MALGAREDRPLPGRGAATSAVAGRNDCGGGTRRNADFAALSLSASSVQTLPNLGALQTGPAPISLFGTSRNSCHTALSSSANLSEKEASRRLIFNKGQLDSLRTFSLLASLKQLCLESKTFCKACRIAEDSGWSFRRETPVTSSLALAVHLVQQGTSVPGSLLHCSSGSDRNLPSQAGLPERVPLSSPAHHVYTSGTPRASLALTLRLPSFFDLELLPLASSTFEATLRYAPAVRQDKKKSSGGTRTSATAGAGPGAGAETARRSRIRRILNAIINRKNRIAPSDPVSQSAERYDASSLGMSASDKAVGEGGEEVGDVAVGKGQEKKRVLILMSDTGGGHRASAEAIKATFEMEFGDKYEVKIIDLWKDHTPFPFNQMPKSYSFLVRHETLWRMAFHATRPRFVHQPQMAATGAFVAREVGKMLDTHRPDIMVSVHPLMQHIPLRVLRSRGLLHHIPFTTVITDLTTCHPTWFHKWVSLCFCPTQEVARRALKAGLTSPQLRVYGLPIRPAFSRPPSLPKEELRKQLGMDPELPAALLMGGGEGMGPVETTALALARRLGGCLNDEDPGVESEARGQLVVVCGRNKKLRAKLESVDWPMPTLILGFVSNMPDLMAACDCIITKAGPGTIAESLIRGLPLILNDFIAGQEVGNVPYVVDNGAGVFCDVPREIGQIVSDWFGPQKQEFAEMSRKAKAMARPDAVFRIVRDLDLLVCGQKMVQQGELALVA